MPLFQRLGDESELRHVPVPAFAQLTASRSLATALWGARSLAGLLRLPLVTPSCREKLQWLPEFDDSLPRCHFRYLTAIHNSINYDKDAATILESVGFPSNGALKLNGPCFWGAPGCQQRVENG